MVASKYVLQDDGQSFFFFVPHHIRADHGLLLEQGTQACGLVTALNLRITDGLSATEPCREIIVFNHEDDD